MLGRLYQGTIKGLLLGLGVVEVVIALLGLPYMIRSVAFYEIGSYVRLFVYLMAAGLLPIGALKALQRRPVAWVFVMAGHIMWFSWAAASIDFFQELLRHAF